MTIHFLDADLGIDASPIGSLEMPGRIAKTPADQLKRIEKLIAEGG